MSGIAPTIVLDDAGHVISVAGASGGSKIITAVAQTLIRTLYLGQNVKEAVDARRFHHQLFPNELMYEKGSTSVGIFPSTDFIIISYSVVGRRLGKVWT